MAIIELLSLLDSVSLSLTAKELIAHNGEGEDRDSVASVQMSQAHEFPPHAHTPCFVSDTAETIYTYIMRLSGLYCSQYILPVQLAGVRAN